MDGAGSGLSERRLAFCTEPPGSSIKMMGEGFTSLAADFLSPPASSLEPPLCLP